MSATDAAPASSTSATIPFWAQLAAWLTGLGLCIYGLFDTIAAWSFPYTLSLLCLLAIAPVCWGWRSRRRAAVPIVQPTSWQRRVLICLLLAGCSFGMSEWTALQIGDYPPAYHDEYSYLFQAKTFLAGRAWFPSHPTHPELFNQVHVLNDNGRMASRYFPGTGLWMAPFVAIGRPYLGHWLCGMLATLFVYAAGCELGNERTGLIAGLLTALSPGLALFSNLLLAHHSTLLGLSFFLWRMSRFERTRWWFDAATAAIGLSWAMLCRPMTAAAVGLPFGVWTAWWLVRGAESPRQKVAAFGGFAVPIVLGFAVQLAENVSITGNLWTSPYQLYTDIYTPRHVYGFNNVIRGEQRLGPKVLDGYDRWAQNLTPELAAHNVVSRWENSCLWTWDLLPLVMVQVLVLCIAWWFDLRIQLIGWSIISLHVAHIPYWYDGIMGWHYVFESAILWTLLMAVVCDRLLADWRQSGRLLMTGWLIAFGLLTCAGNLVTLPNLWTAKLSQQIPSIRYPRRMQGEFRQWVAASVGHRPAVVLVAPHKQDQHLDYVVNDPGLASPILYGRFVPGQTDVDQIARDFPDRTVFLCQPDQQQIRPIVAAE